RGRRAVLHPQPQPRGVRRAIAGCAGRGPAAGCRSACVVSVGTDLLQAFGQVEARCLLPRVRALHLPQEQTCGRKQSAFCALELDDGTIGLAYVGLGDARAQLAQSDQVGGADPLILLRGCAQPEAAARVLGFATANALTRWLFDRAGFVPPESRDSLGGIAAAPGVQVGMVGL